MPEIEAAARLKQIWLDNKSRLGLTQETLGQEYRGADGKPITQGAVSHYMNAVSPLNAWACLEFSRILQCDVADFAPDKIIEELKVLGSKDESSGYFKVHYYRPPANRERSDSPIITLPIEWAADRDVPMNMVTAVECGDDGMTGHSLKAGSTVLVRRDRATVENGKIYAIDFGNRVVVRRAFRKGPGTIVLMADQPDIEPEFIRTGDLDRIVVIGEASQALIDLN